MHPTRFFAAALTLTAAAWPLMSDNAFAAGSPYVGAFVGYVSMDPTARDGSGGPVSYSADGATGGVQAGYDWNFGQYAIGVVADIAGDEVRGTSYDSSGPVIFKIDQQWDASFRARFAYPMQGFTPYLTGGLAYAQFESKYSQVGLPFFVTDFDRTGWTLDAGVEVPMSGTMSLSAEYRYADYGSDGTLPDGPYKLTTNRVTLGVNYGF